MNVDTHNPNKAVMLGGSPARGMRVHVSDASPKGFWGHVTAVHGEAVTVTRDGGARVLVMLSRRRVIVERHWP
jgi:hypothetical protein